ncbi:MAG: MerR family transcriptional regulator [Candidatus Aminicenantales bacterium]
MNDQVYTQEEFAAKTGISAPSLSEWIKLKLIKPTGFTDGQIPLYSDILLERVMHIQKLIELGYSLEEIQKIIRKIGIPRGKRNLKEPADSDRYLTIGTLAERTGLSPRTIKHWEDKGIIEPDMRSEGGFRIYSGVYVYLCKLIKDLQLFGYTLEEIKVISEYFRDFLNIKNHRDSLSRAEVSQKLDKMLSEIQALFEKMDLLKEGIARWEDLLKKKKKEILSLKNRNQKRQEAPKGA